MLRNISSPLSNACTRPILERFNSPLSVPVVLVVLVVPVVLVVLVVLVVVLVVVFVMFVVVFAVRSPPASCVFVSAAVSVSVAVSCAAASSADLDVVHLVVLLCSFLLSSRCRVIN